jgi:hypothetical protein
MMIKKEENMGIKKAKIDFFTYLLFICIIAFTAFPALAYDLKDYFPLDDGCTWNYQERINGEVINTERGSPLDTVKIKGAEKILDTETKLLLSFMYEGQYVAIDAEGVKLFKTSNRDNSDYSLFDPPKMLYPNIELGANKEYPFKSAIFNLMDVIYENSRKAGVSTITLDGLEDAGVPAGKFTNCLKYTSVDKIVEGNGGENSNITVVSWLAPGVGLVKRSFAVKKHNQDTGQEEVTVKDYDLVSAIISGRVIPGTPDLITASSEAITETGVPSVEAPQVNVETPQAVEPSIITKEPQPQGTYGTGEVSIEETMPKSE